MRQRNTLKQQNIKARNRYAGGAEVLVTMGVKGGG